MKTSIKSNYTEFIDAITMLGFEPIEMNFFRRIDAIDDEVSSNLIIYCELLDNKAIVSVYKDAMFLEEIYFEKPIEFIDFVEKTLKTYGVDSIELQPIDSSITVNGKKIVTAATSSRDFIKKLIKVKSSNMWSYAFEPKDDNIGTMIIQFKGSNGGPDDIYMYYDVPSKLWRKFVAAPSKGHFFWEHIRNVFKYSKLTGDKRTKLPNGI